MLNAISLDNIRAKKKTSLGFIIPASHFSEQIITNNKAEPKSEIANTIIETEVKPVKIAEKVEPVLNNTAAENVISKYSILGFQKKKEADLIQKNRVSQTADGPRKEVNYTDLVTNWNAFAKKLNQNGEKIMYTYMVLDTPKLNGTKIELEFPNQSSKEDFLKRQGNLMAFLREKLENIDLSLEISVSVEIKQKFVYTAEEKFNKLKDINPNLDLLKRLFELELN